MRPLTLKLPSTTGNAIGSLPRIAATPQTRLIPTQPVSSPVNNVDPFSILLQIVQLFIMDGSTQTQGGNLADTGSGNYSVPSSTQDAQTSVPGFQTNASGSQTSASGSQTSGGAAINDKISVVGTSRDARHKNQDGNITLRAADGIQTGDVMVLTVSGSDGKDNAAPPEGWQLIKSEGDGDLNTKVYYKVYNEGDEREFQIAKNGSANYFGSLTTLRGVDPNNPIVDASSDNNTGSGQGGKALAPSANGVAGGAQFVAFSYDDPHVASINGVQTLSAFNNGDDGQATGIVSTNRDGATSEISAIGQRNEAGGGRDQAVTVTFRPL